MFSYIVYTLRKSIRLKQPVKSVIFVHLMYWYMNPSMPLIHILQYRTFSNSSLVYTNIPIHKWAAYIPALSLILRSFSMFQIRSEEYDLFSYTFLETVFCLVSYLFTLEVCMSIIRHTTLLWLTKTHNPIQECYINPFIFL